MKYQLYYDECGQGQPMVLLHGNGEDHTYFERQIQYFSNTYRVYAVDTRGHGKSPRGTAPFTLHQFVEDLKHFLDTHKLEKIILLGFSDGGNIALLFAVKYPEYLDKLILNGANIYPGGMKRKVLLSLYGSYLRTVLAERGSRRMTRKRELLCLMLYQPRLHPKALRQIKAPALVIAGDRDMIKTRHTKMIARNIPGSSLCILKGDHFLAAKESEAFNQAVERFLAIGKEK